LKNIKKNGIIEEHSISVAKIRIAGGKILGKKEP
jgi:hypothetical protein